ncbi:MAG: hypothetical protein ACYTHM_23565, partial [Planctomycetota bacterium]
MPIIVECGECGWRGEAKDSFAGKTVKCKSCKSSITIPKEEEDWEYKGEEEPSPPSSGEEPKASIRRDRESTSRKRAPPSKGSMAPLIIVGVLAGMCLVLSLITGLGYGVYLALQPPDTPKEVWEKVKKLRLERDWKGLLYHTSDDLKSEFRKDIEEMKAEIQKGESKQIDEIERVLGISAEKLKDMDWEEIWILSMEKNEYLESSEKVKKWTFVDEAIDGDGAEVRYRGKYRTETMDFVKEGRRWKLGQNRKARIQSRERHAIACLKSICTGQEQFKNSVSIDLNRNGVGEYGFLSELAGKERCRGGG